MLRPDTGARVGGRVNEHLVVTHVVRETMEENRLITYIVERRLDLRPAHVRMIAHPALLTSGFGRASGRTHAESEVVPATPAPAHRTRLIWPRPSPNTAWAVGAHIGGLPPPGLPHSARLEAPGATRTRPHPRRDARRGRA